MAAQPQQSFPGYLELIESIDHAVRFEAENDIVRELRGALCRLIRSDSVELPQEVFQTAEGRYARRELHRSEELGYSVIAMTWGPGQGTPIHDHCGMWCVEGVWHGELEVVQYDLTQEDGDRFNFREVGAIQAGQGSAGSLIPPHEYHTIKNAHDDQIAVSVHVYSGCMTNCNVFMPIEGDWYQRQPKSLYLDS
ncbi:MAG: cysteine dioxygenase family protein [Pseudomonadota bacterium]